MKLMTKGRGPNAFYVLGSLYPHVTGGMEVFNYYFLRQQASDQSQTIYYFGDHRPEQENVQFVPWKKRIPVRFFYPLQFFNAIRKHRKKIDFAYISYAEQSWIIPLTQSLILQLFRIPYVVTIHWGIEPRWNFPFPFLFFFRHARAIVGVSEPVCEYYRKLLPGKEIRYIPPLIPFTASVKNKNQARKEFGFGVGDYIILFAGALKKMKNPDKIIAALSMIGKSFLDRNNVKLLLLGTGGMETELKSTVQQSGLEKHVYFPGLVDRQQMPDYFRMADCYIISSDYEGTSISLLEAMYNQLPIIASNAPGINRMLTNNENAILYKTQNTNELADAFQTMITDSELAGRLASNARLAFDRNYAYERIIADYSHVFAAVSGKAGTFNEKPVYEGQPG